MTYGRRGAVVLTAVMVLAVIAGITAFAYQSLWRGSARTLFCVQEHRELLNLGRSALAEAYFIVQKSFDVADRSWMDWCTSPLPVEERKFKPAQTILQAPRMAADANALQYSVVDEVATLTRVVPLSRTSPGDALGIVDLKVTVMVKRAATSHEAKLTMTERRSFWLANNEPPYGTGGRRPALSKTPVMTAIGED